MNLNIARCGITYVCLNKLFTCDGFDVIPKKKFVALVQVHIELYIDIEQYGAPYNSLQAQKSPYS